MNNIEHLRSIIKGYADAGVDTTEAEEFIGAVESVLTVDGGRDGELKYNPVLLNRLLKAMQGDVLTVHQASGKYYFTSEDGSMSLIMEIN